MDFSYFNTAHENVTYDSEAFDAIHDSFTSEIGEFNKTSVNDVNKTIAEEHSHIRILDSANSTEKHNNFGLPLAYVIEAAVMAVAVVLTHKFSDAHTMNGGPFKGLKPVKLVGSLVQTGILIMSPYVNSAVADEIGVPLDATTTLITAGIYQITRMFCIKLASTDASQTSSDATKNAQIVLEEASKLQDVAADVSNIIISRQVVQHGMQSVVQKVVEDGVKAVQELVEIKTIEQDVNANKL
ncbi:hypothetical protein MIDIC_590014 [Alphaproteobacteria bacterium]